MFIKDKGELMKREEAVLHWQLKTNCPECDINIDLAEEDYPDIDFAIFNNKWDVLKDYEVMCPECAVEFKIKEIIY